MLLTRVYDALLTIAYPQVCLVCGASVEQRSLGVACARCWAATRVFKGTEVICRKCGALSPAGEVVRGVDVAAEIKHDVHCHRCDSQSFTAARAVGVYEHALRQSVLSLKRQPHVAPFLTQLLLNTATREPLSESTRIIPVPLHDARVQERGFNQAEIIADSLSRPLRLPVDRVSLVRVRGSEKYRAGLDAKGRRDTVAAAFAVRQPRLVEDEAVLLVDDVFTTGATVDACAQALLASGARQVFVLTIARGKS